MIIVFDTETTGLIKGLIKDKDHIFYEIDKGNTYPHMIQLSYIIYMETDITHISNEYFQLKKDVILTNEIENITGITEEILNKKGSKNKKHSLKVFIEYVLECDKLIGHNIKFDILVLLIEIKRIQMYYKYDSINEYLEYKWSVFYEKISRLLSEDKEKCFCTMKKSLNIYKNDKVFITTSGKIKYPKLIELFKHLYKREPILPLHNSLSDTYYCLLCYTKLQNIDEEKINRLLIYETKLLS